MTRRDIAWLLPVLALAEQAEGADDAAPTQSAVFRFDQLTQHKNPNGNVTRPVLKGKLPTGELVEVHDTTLAPGNMPHPPHRHKHSELMLLREGNLELILDGKSEPVGPGDIAYCASNQLHGLKNVGSIPANYFVIAIGPDI
jgi:quercetin dioxygenase-like cupin family protein